jgi:Flp pilus assembly secretin CpaC
MNFRETAALGLSTLILGGNTLLPYAQGSTIVINNHPGTQQNFINASQNPMFATLAQQQFQYRFQMQHKHNFFSLLNQLNPFNMFSPRKNQTIRVAKSVPITPTAKVLAAMPLKESVTENTALSKAAIAKDKNAKDKNAQNKKAASIAAKTKHEKLAPSGKNVKATAMPLMPTVAINPTIKPIASSAINPSTDKAQTALSATNAGSPATAGATTLATPIADTQSTPAMADATPHVDAAQATGTPVYQAHSQTPDTTNTKTVAFKRPTAEEAFQMLAATPLEQLALQTRATLQNQAKLQTPKLQTQGTLHTQYPAFDFTHSNNDVKVLKSGISEKMTNVDLTVGKAEVIYLSRPATRVSVSNPDVASAVIISPTQIQLVGKAVGVSNLLIWGDMISPEHTVVDIGVHRDVSVLVNQLKYVDPGIQIVPMAAEDTVILTGQAETRESAQLAIDMAKAFFSKGGSSSAGGTASGASASSGPSSQSPGSATPGGSANVINLVKVKGEPSTKLELVRQKLNEVDSNIRIDVVPGPDGAEKVILSGRVSSASIASKALNLTSVFYGKPGLKMVTGQGGNDFTRMQVNSTSGSSSSGGGSATVQSGDSAGGANMLQGSVMTDATGNVISMLEIAQKPQIRCNIKFLELNKTALNAMGGTLTGARGSTKFTSWSGVHSPAPGNVVSVPSTTTPPGGGWSTTATRDALGNGWQAGTQAFASTWAESFQNGVTQVFTINNQMVAAIQALEERRQVRTLAEPTLTMLSGEQGSFLAGGEIPIAFLGGNGSVSIEFKEYGIRLNLLPTVTDDGKIQMQVAPEVSSVDQSITVQGVPGFSTRRMSTNLLVEPGQSFVLAGLFKQEDTNSVSRLPGIGSLPIIGPFFRNKWKTHNNTEMVVLIKPEVVYSQTGPTNQNPAVGNNVPEFGNDSALSKK